MHRALHMKASEKRQRLRSLRTEVLRIAVHRWADGYIAVLEGK